MSLQITEKQKLLFWLKVKKTDNCWEWTACKNSKGYGVSGVSKTPLAHRVSYELLKDDIPDGLQLDHLCRNRACVNPDHLEAVTNRENILRSKLFRDRCPKGHLYDKITKEGYRGCNICHKKQMKEGMVRYLEKNKDLHLQNVKNWQRKNPEKLSKYSQTYRLKQ